MEGGDQDVDAKRPRLEPVAHGLPAPPPPPSSQAHHPRPLHYSEPPPSHPYPRNLPPIPHPQVPLSGPTYREPAGSVYDSRAAAVEHRALPDPQAFPQPRPGYEAYETPAPSASRSYSSSSIPRATTTPVQPATTDAQRRPSLTVAVGYNHEQHPPLTPMEHGGHPHVYTGVDHHRSNGASNGYPPATPHEQYTPGPMGPAQGYAPTPITAYGPPSLYGQPSQYHQPRRKQVRAAQACNNCRQRKQKCDEQRPCAFCREQTLECEYKDVPPPKQDRTMIALLEKVDSMMQAQQDLRQEFLGRLTKIERRLPAKPPAQDSPSSTGSRMRLPSLLSDPDGGPSPRPSVGQPSPASVNVPIIPMLANRDPPAGFPENVASGDHKQYPEPVVSDDQSDEVEAGLPADHTTAAHQLLTQWAKVMQPFFKGTGVEDEHYVMRLEHGRGVLRPYGWGEGDDVGDGGHQLGSPAGSSDRDTYSPAPSPREGIWGTGLSPAANVEVKRSDPTLAGDLNPNGSLKLDKPTVDRLFASYMRNIHILHPFLNEIRLSKMIEVFANRYSSGAASVRSPGFAVQSLTSQPLKRKRSNGGTSGMGFSSMPEPGFSNLPKPSLERSISSAIVLLVLALGRICEHKQPLPGPMETPASNTDIHGMLGMDSPVAAYRASPASSHSTLASTSSPSNEPTRFVPSRRPSLEALPAHEQSLFIKRNRNVDIIPGFAYYARATDILGNLHGGNDLSHAQANLLAGLYMGQLARVVESWEWIFSASIKCRILIEQVICTNPNALSRNTTAKGQKLVHEDLIKFCFWTCLQLESDILAELSNLPHSGIGQYEQRVAWPTGVREDLAETQKLTPHVETIMLYYSAQIHLRKELNRVHRILYSKKGKSKRSKRGGWANAADPTMLQEMLEAWRATLPPSFQWSDSDPAPEDINAARLRAKYYGAKYIITRPFLYRAVVEMKPRPDLLFGVEQDPQGMQRSGSNNSGTPSSGVARFEQNLSTEDARAVIEASRVCVQAAMKSTVAFDRLKTEDGQKSRPVVTNIFGTAHAQYGNMLVLAATHNSWLKPLIPREELDRLLDRTINLLDDLAPISPTMKANAAILRNTKAVIHSAGTSLPMSAHSSFAER